MLDKLEAIKERYQYLEEKLGDPAVIMDQKAFAKARAKKAGRVYPNLVDNAAASRKSK